MPNIIALRKQYSTLLDEVYKLASLTSMLDGPNELVQQGANANEILIPKCLCRVWQITAKQPDMLPVM